MNKAIFTFILASGLTALDLSIVPLVRAQYFTAASSMSTGRYRPAVVSLTNGMVLVAGGGFTNSAELFNPVTGTWTNTGPMHSGRSYHTATLLLDGRVLVAGGTSSGSDLSAELYDPVTETWAYTGMMLYWHSGNSATLLPNGKVLVAGVFPVPGSPQTNNCELFDPVTSTWSSTESLKTNRWEHTATLLPDGKVLVAGGNTRMGSSGIPLSGVEIYDVNAGTWTNGPAMPAPHWLHTATLLSDGEVLIAGGDSSAFIASTNADLYNPTTQKWTNRGSLNIARARHSATLLRSGKVLVTGGDAALGTALASAELYDPLTATWTTISDMNFPRFHHRSEMLPDGRVLIVGGSTNLFTGLASAELFIQPFLISVFSNSITDGFLLCIEGVSATNAVIVQASSNLSDWSPILTNGAATGSVQFLDTDATNWTSRFYRALQQ